jgi:hypothetical protein
MELTTKNGDRPELNLYTPRNDLVGKSRPRPQLGNHRSDVGVPALQLKRRHPIAVVAYEYEIASFLRLPNPQVAAIHVNEDIRLRRPP